MASNDKEQSGDSKGDTTNRPTSPGPPDDRQTQLPKMDALPLPTAPGQNEAKWEADTVIPGSRDPQITNTFDSGNDVPFDSKRFVNDEVADRTTKVRYFGDYELLSEIARGGMGVVYKARQVNLNRIVALKMILAGQLASDEEVQRFRSEAEAAANLDHPGIVPIFEIGQHEGLHFFSMGYVDGCSLSDRVRNGPLAPREAAELSRKVAEAISYAHGRNVIHRDLKPANVLLDQSGEPKVTDFGLARRMDSDSGMTKTGAVMGTPSYMPPEQAAGKISEVGPWSDVYSLGAILYCLLTGRPPFQAANPLDTILQVMERDPVSVSTINPEIQRDLETICHKCLQKEPAKRYASAQDFADDLGRWLRGEPIKARAISSSERVWRWMRRNPTISASAMVTVAAVVCVLMLAVKAIHDSNILTSLTEQTEIQRKLIASQQRLADAATEKADAAERAQARAEAAVRLAQEASEEQLEEARRAKTEAVEAQEQVKRARAEADSIITQAKQQLADTEIKSKLAVEQQLRAEAATRNAQFETQRQSIVQLILIKDYESALQKVNHLMESDLLKQLPKDIADQHREELERQRDELRQKTN